MAISFSTAFDVPQEYEAVLQVARKVAARLAPDYVQNDLRGEFNVICGFAHCRRYSKRSPVETAILAISFRPFCSSDHDERPRNLPLIATWARVI